LLRKSKTETQGTGEHKVSDFSALLTVKTSFNGKNNYPAIVTPLWSDANTELTPHGNLSD